jgi:hypothetical protein
MGSNNGSSSSTGQQQQQQPKVQAQQQQQQPSPRLSHQAHTPTQQHKQQQQQQVTFKFGVDSPADSRQAAQAAAAAAAAAVAARHHQASRVADGTGSSSSPFDSFQPFRLRLADSIPRQLPAAMQQQQAAQPGTPTSVSHQQQQQQQQQPHQPNDTRVAPLLQGQSPPPTPEGAGVTPARLFEGQQQQQQQQQQPEQQDLQQQQGRGRSSSLSVSIPQLLPSAQPDIPSSSSSEGLGPLAARMFGQSVDLQTGDMEWTCGRLLGEWQQQQLQRKQFFCVVDACVCGVCISQAV